MLTSLPNIRAIRGNERCRETDPFRDATETCKKKAIKLLRPFTTGPKIYVAERVPSRYVSRRFLHRFSVPLLPRTQTAQKFLEGSKKTLAEINQRWDAKRDSYRQQLERENDSTLDARERIQLLAEQKEHFERFREREDKAVEWKRETERQRRKERERGKGGRGD